MTSPALSDSGGRSPKDACQVTSSHGRGHSCCKFRAFGELRTIQGSRSRFRVQGLGFRVLGEGEGEGEVRVCGADSTPPSRAAPMYSNMIIGSILLSIRSVVDRKVGPLWTEKYY